MDERQIAIQLKNVSKSYTLFKNDKQRLWSLLFKGQGGRVKTATDNISLVIERGESVALFGRNGAGKSTLLKIITGVTYPTTGYVRVNGRVSSMLEMTTGFDPHLSGRENIYFRGDILGVPYEEIKALEKDIIAFAELDQYIDQPVRTYSSGMRARLGFAINASIKPDVLIVDEALSVGDSNFRSKCRNKIREILDSGASFLFVTHATSDAKAFCKRGVVLHRGTLLFDGSVAEAAAFYNRMIGKKQ